MRVCGVCGEVYEGDVRVCAVDGEPLRSWANTVQVFAQVGTLVADSASIRVGTDEEPAPTDEHPPAVIDVPSAPAPGHVLSKRYLLKHQLGVGGFGAVFEAQDKRLRKRVAVKILSPTIAQNPEALERFELEAISASQIGHHGIIDVTDFDNCNGMYFLVMEFLDGVDLMHAIDEAGYLEPVRSLRFAAQAADAINAAHEVGILHRDLKPPNLYVTRRPDGSERIKVIDFGISKVMHQPLEGRKLTSQGQVLGTPYYMAPEQASGATKLDGRCDVYSLGIILYEMVTGETPFDGETYLQLVTKHLTQQPEPPSAVEPSVPPEVDELILKALEKSPAQRFKSMAEFRDRLRSVADALEAEGREARKTADTVAIPRTPSPTPRTPRTRRTPPDTTLGRASGQLQVDMLGISGDEGAAAAVGTRRSTPMIAIALAGAVVVGTVAFFVLRGGGRESRSSDEVAAVIDPGTSSDITSVRLVTEPSAQVFVGGELLGVTPLDVDVPADGTAIDVSIEQDGFAPIARTVSRRDGPELKLELSPAEPVANAAPDAGAPDVVEPKVTHRTKRDKRDKADQDSGDKDSGDTATEPPPADPPPDDDFLQPARDNDDSSDDFLQPAR